LAGVTPELMTKLTGAGVHSRDDLADLATDELTDITGQTPEEATTLIMLARAHWFAGDEAQSNP
jgi:N utilization substance protein A